MIVQHHESDYLTQARDRSVRPAVRRRASDRAKIMALAIHPYISGQPHRIKYLEADLRLREPGFDGVLHWNGAQILDWYMGQTGGAKK